MPCESVYYLTIAQILMGVREKIAQKLRMLDQPEVFGVGWSVGRYRRIPEDLGGSRKTPEAVSDLLSRAILHLNPLVFRFRNQRLVEGWVGRPETSDRWSVRPSDDPASQGIRS